ncbi:MAG: AAA family ATPase [Bacteroidales bacterium]|nr:AAA family ATPase [Bacteroidales bacterium]
MKNKIFKRKLYQELLDWKETDNGSTAILIKGARRVGKSTLVSQFAKQEYRSHIVIDFSKVSREVMHLFDDITDMDYIFNRLQIIYGTTLIPRNSVIVFDEVQKCPNARQAIKHLVADGRYDYIETGSLISIRKNVENIIIPSEEESVDLHPMDYEEFLWALEDYTTIEQLQQFFNSKKPLGNAIHRILMKDFRLYMLVGGMPQAVAKYLETKNLAQVDRVKRQIIKLYDSDFMKIDPSGDASAMFRAIPSELTRNSNRYQVTSATDGGRASRLTETLAAIGESMVVNFAYHANDPSVGMALHRDKTRFKMFLCDTGLFVTLAFWDKKFTDNVIYEKLLSNKLSADLGYVYENIVAQMLKAKGNELYYYTFPTEKGSHNYEIDFILLDGVKIIPIEVKSSGYKTHASLDAFCQKFSSRISRRYLIYTKDIMKESELLYLPVYMTPLIE